MRTVAAAGAPVVMSEYETIRVSGLKPSDSDLDLAASERLAQRIGLSWLSGGVLEIRSNSHLGVVELDCVTIQVTPKLVGSELSVLKMLDYALGLRALKDIGTLRALPTDGLHLRDLVCLLLNEACDGILRHGPRRDYIRREETLLTVRGRIRPDRQVLRQYGRLDRLECRYDEQSHDIPDNRLCSLGLRIAATAALDDSVRKKSRRLAAEFAELAAPDDGDPRDLLDRVVYHRGNDHYRTAHRWAALLLGLGGFSDLFSGDGPQSSAFMINMNRLFEAFVARLFLDAARATGVSVHPGVALKDALCDPGGRCYTPITPDLQLVKGHGRAARRQSVDAKYKLYSDKRVSTADLFQSFAYAQALRTDEHGVPTAYIVHAGDRPAPSKTITLHHYDRRPAARITAIVLDLPTVLSKLDDARETAATAEALIGQIFTSDQEVDPR